MLKKILCLILIAFLFISTIPLVTFAASPSVVTGGVTNITKSSATVKANIDKNGGTNITSVRFYYGLTEADEMTNYVNVTSYNIKGGEISVTISGLKPGTIYYYMPVITNAEGLGSSGNFGSFTTLSDTSSTPPEVTPPATTPTVTPPATGPSVTTKEAINITSTSATLKCYIDKNGGYNITSIKFYYGTSINEMKPITVTGYNPTDRDISVTISGLKPGTTYYYVPEIMNSQGLSAAGGCGNFTTLSADPSVTTKEAINITSTSATLKCYIDKNGGYNITSIKFYYGTSINEMKPITVTGYNPTDRDISVTISGLKPGTTYYYIPEVFNSLGLGASGVYQSFTTLSANPSVTTQEVINITKTSATLKCYIDKNGGYDITSIKFYYGTSQNGMQPITVTGYKPTDRDISVTISGLTPGTKYYFTPEVVNSLGLSASGGYGSFVTLSADPSVITRDATVLTTASALLKCYIDKNGGYDITSVKFYYGTSPTGEMKDYVEVKGYNPKGGEEISRAITGLKPGTTYYYIPVVTNASGFSAAGSCGKFTTLSESPVISVTGLCGLTGPQEGSYPLSGVINSKINIDTVTIGILNYVDCYDTKKNLGTTKFDLWNFTVDTRNPYTPNSTGTIKCPNPLVNPGTYTLTVWAKTVDGNSVYLGCCLVTVLPSAKIASLSLNGTGSYTLGDTINVTAAYSDCDRIQFYVPETGKKWTYDLKEKSGKCMQNITVTASGNYSVQVTGYNQSSASLPKTMQFTVAEPQISSVGLTTKPYKELSSGLQEKVYLRGTAINCNVVMPFFDSSNYSVTFQLEEILKDSKKVISTTQVKSQQSQITVPVSSSVGTYRIHAILNKGTKVINDKYSENFYIIFNPFNPQDKEVYIGESESMINSLIGNEDYTWMTCLSSELIPYSKWILGINDPGVFKLAMEAIDGSSTAKEAALKLKNKVFYMIEGNWEDDTRSDSYKMMHNPKIAEYIQNPKLYGQCFNYSALYTAFLRSVGIPSRMATAVPVYSHGILKPKDNPHAPDSWSQRLGANFYGLTHETVDTYDNWGDQNNHVWTEVFLGKWLACDVTYGREPEERIGPWFSNTTIFAAAVYVGSSKDDQRQFYGNGVTYDLSNIKTP